MNHGHLMLQQIQTKSGCLQHVAVRSGCFVERAPPPPINKLQQQPYATIPRRLFTRTLRSD